MALHSKEPDSYIIDSYKSGGNFMAGAILFRGRKKLETIQWKEEFVSQEEADGFVRDQPQLKELKELANEGDLTKYIPTTSRPQMVTLM